MKFLILVSSDNPEVVWNAFRLSNLILDQGDQATIFLNGPAVAYQKMDSERFPLKKLAKNLTLAGGGLWA
ncbi:sulfur reduction protein DsrE [Thermosulfuriphilus sp.]